MLYEKKVGSFARLLKEAAVMDADAGIRVLGRYLGRKCIVFVTRFGRRYNVMVYEAGRGRKPAPGRRLAFEEIEGIEGLRLFLRKFAQSRVEAYVY